MKKLISLFLIILLFASFLLATDWYYYIGKKVSVQTINNTYVGKVTSILTMEICKQRDGFGNCIWKDIFYTMLLNENNVIKVIPCESIKQIEEIK